MKRFDLVIAGSGFLPAVLALKLRAAQSRLRILLLSGDQEIPGRGLELAFPQRLPDAVAAVIAPCIVAEWPAVMVARGEEAVRRGEPAALVDPLQLWAELLNHFDPAALVAGCEVIEGEGGRVAWAGNQVETIDFIDLRPVTGHAEPCDIVAGAGLAGLELPALSDFAAPAEPWSCLLNLPIGNGHIAVRRLGRETAGWIPREITGLEGPDYYEFLSAIGSGLA